MFKFKNIHFHLLTLILIFLFFCKYLQVCSRALPCNSHMSYRCGSESCRTQRLTPEQKSASGVLVFFAPLMSTGHLTLYLSSCKCSVVLKVANKAFLNPTSCSMSKGIVVPWDAHSYLQHNHTQQHTTQ